MNQFDRPSGHRAPADAGGRASEPVDILIVDDRPENLQAAEAVLESLGQRIVTAASGHDALRHALSRDFAVILLDVQMEGMDGIETASLLKARERTRHTPIIFLTAGSADVEHAFEGYAAGAVDYLTKPFRAEILRAKVSVFIELAQKNRQIERQHALLRARSAEVEWEIEERYRAAAGGGGDPCFRRFVEAAAVGMLAMTPAGEITYANPRAHAQVGRTAPGLVGCSFFELLTEDGTHAMRTRFATHRGLGEAVHVRLRVGDAGTRDASVILSPFFDERGAPAGLLAVVSLADHGGGGEGAGRNAGAP